MSTKNYVCCCERQFDTTEQTIRCHDKHDRDNPMCLYDRIGDVGDPRLNALIKLIRTERHQYRELEAKLRKVGTAYELTNAERAELSQQISIIKGVLNLADFAKLLPERYVTR